MIRFNLVFVIHVFMLLSCSSFGLYSIESRHRVRFVLDDGQGEVYVLYWRGTCRRYGKVWDEGRGLGIHREDICIWHWDEDSGRLLIGFVESLDYGLLFFVHIHSEPQRYYVFEHGCIRKKYPAPVFLVVLTKVSKLLSGARDVYVLELHREGSRLFCGRDRFSNRVCYYVVHEE